MLEILKDGDKTLLKRAKRVDRIDDTIRNVVSSMVDVMLENNGVGISGNQVGILKRIIVVMVNSQPKIMINPEIIFTSEETCKETEGCLSFPGEFYDIERYDKVTVKYRSIAGHPTLETHTGFVARIIQHEIDHLDGITFKQKTL